MCAFVHEMYWHLYVYEACETVPVSELCLFVCECTHLCVRMSICVFACLCAHVGLFFPCQNFRLTYNDCFVFILSSEHFTCLLESTGATGKSLKYFLMHYSVFFCIHASYKACMCAQECGTP